MNTDENHEPLSHEHNLKWIRPTLQETLQATDMLTIYRWDPDDHRQSSFIVSGLIPSGLASVLPSETSALGVRVFDSCRI